MQYQHHRPAQTGGESAVRETRPPQAAQADITPPPTQDAVDEAAEAAREQLRTHPPLVVEAALQELAEAAHSISDSEPEGKADATPKPLEAQTQASSEQSAQEVTRSRWERRPDNTAANTRKERRLDNTAANTTKERRLDNTAASTTDNTICP